MAIRFHHIAYRALDVCNAVEMAAIEAAVARTGLSPGARVLDIGCGNGAVAARLAAMGFAVTAVERDADMADLARERTADSGAEVIQADSGEVLAASQPWDLILALGATEAAAAGLREPQAVLARLKQHLRPGGWLLWGDLFWAAEPPAPLRMLVEATNDYLSHEGWQAAARAAGYGVELAQASSAESWDRYTAAMDGAARDWLAVHGDAPEAATVRAAADRVRTMFDFGRPYIGFGLYLLKAD